MHSIGRQTHSQLHIQIQMKTNKRTHTHAAACHMCSMCGFLCDLFDFHFRSYLLPRRHKQICDFIVFIFCADSCYDCFGCFGTLCNLVGCNLLLILMFKLRTACNSFDLCASRLQIYNMQINKATRHA